MKRSLLAAVCCLFITLAYAEQPKPIIVEGRYSPSSYSLQPAETLQTEAELASSLTEINEAFENKDYNSVIKLGHELLEKGFEDPNLDTALARAYEDSGKLDDALYYARQAIAKRPSNVEAYTTRANIYFQKGDMLRAREDIDTALKLNPKSTRAQEMRSKIYNDASSSRVRKTKQKSKGMPPWFFVYVLCVLAVVAFYIFLRFHKAKQGALEEKGRSLKEVNIKEQYKFIRPIGEGGMGKVYEAYDNVLKRKVAVKRIRPELLKSRYVREQFLAEARTVAMLRNPHIVEIYTVIETKNSLYLVFEYVEGQTLETRLDIDGYILFPEVKGIFDAVCKGLSYAHSHNIIHCDLKPGNIMISDTGIAKVMDFGVAKRVPEGGGVDPTTIAGTPAYMSPEQQKGFMTKQSDIYSLAVCLYESLVGQVPWSVKGYDLATKKIVLPSDISPTIPTEIDYLIETSLNEDPALRIQTVDEFNDILQNARNFKKQN
ncbi:MAG: protein kinase [Elusimicrobiota bacterium]|jgi:tRNA A-37 threonylcarbamoyl transferase component Bud32|nr:protein kinase [Elusimicrobiota bacterium]